MTIKIVPPATVLLITGPNTGGKTVALKTAGLLALMAQAGLRIPAADGSRLPVFRSMFADIGDEQSIDASLSTFSAHITNIASMDRGLAVPALVLLDEVGSGTDPVEGGALGVAVVDHFRARGATVIATSHYDALKTYASTTDGVASAAFGFDAETFAPTYQLIYGSPGRSLALEIAARLGLNPSVDRGRAAEPVSAREAQLAEHLAKIDRDMRALEHEQRLAARERETLEAAEARMRQREDALKQREETFRRRLNEELDAQVRQARREIDDVIAALKAKTTAIAQEAQAGVRPASRRARRAARGAMRAPPSIPSSKRYLEPVAPDAEATPPRRQPRRRASATACRSAVSASKASSPRCTTAAPRSTSAASGCAPTSASCGSSAGAAPQTPRVNVHVELQPRDGDAGRSERDRLHAWTKRWPGPSGFSTNRC